MNDSPFFLFRHREKFLVAIIIISFGILFYFLHDDLKEWSTWLVDNFGYPALALLSLAADTVIQPFAPDIFVFGSAFGGAHPFKSALIAGVASTAGGTTGYFIARRIGPWRFRRIVGRYVFKTARDAMKHYGIYVILIGALTPVPYSATCWMAGLYKMSILVVVGTSLVSRTLRFLAVAWIGTLV